MGAWECRAVDIVAKASVVGEGTGRRQPTDSPGSQWATCRDRADSESTEPLVGRFLRSRIAKALRISRGAVKSRCAGEWGGWGQVSDDGSGQNNPNRSEDPWGRAAKPLAWRCSIGQEASDTVRKTQLAATRSTNGGGKPGGAEGMPGGDLTEALRGKAPPDRPAFQPYWGKPDVRNDRGGGGDVGIIRSPVRATALPDRNSMAPRGRPPVPHPRQQGVFVRFSDTEWGALQQARAIDHPVSGRRPTSSAVPTGVPGAPRRTGSQGADARGPGTAV